MKWLHLSDLHFDPENAGLGTTMLCDELPEYLKKTGIQADHLFFTGDFRNGSQKDNDGVATTAAKFLLDIAESVGISDPRFIHIVPGNHDLTRVESDAKKEEKERERVATIRRAYETAEGRFDKCGLAHSWVASIFSGKLLRS